MGQLLEPWHENDSDLGSQPPKHHSPALGLRAARLRRDEALANYEQAIGLFRDVGDRLGEANTLQGLGGLKEEDEDALTVYREAHQLYQNIGDQYSQARNLR